MPVYQDPDDPRALNADALQAWTAAVLERLGTPPDVAADVAEILLASDRRGIASLRPGATPSGAPARPS